ncbi:hypothetical protein AAFF_G00342110 [Aldrovandia affinis]|uniref:rRNA methyltransferase 1, mitochondrial n=1 Tax=Aldrovandia affinis TaxID=143900 RepID=A0AAD7W092_9TELE|nr:hypothetical protein AAFF_G00342110 [Aldrovandia affinis]
MRLLQWAYRCAGQMYYTRDAILKSGIGGCPQRRPYRYSVTLFYSGDHSSRPAGTRWRGALDSHTSSSSRAGRAASVSKPGVSDCSKANATQRHPYNSEGQGKRVRSEPRLRPDSRLSAELQRLSRDDFQQDEEGGEVERGRAAVGQRMELLFGAAPCLLALTQGRRTLHRLFVKESSAPQRPVVKQACEEARRQLVPIQPVGKKDLDRLCSGHVHQGLCLEAGPLKYLTDEGAAGTDGDSAGAPLWLVLEGVQDPMNLGAILRSAYFLGVDRIASSIRNSCPLTPVVSKASSGVMEIVGVYSYDNLADMLKVKVSQGWQVVGTVGAAEAGVDVPVLPCSDFHLTTPTLLLIGGESAGLSPELRQLCHTLLTIAPCRDLHPAVESLNVSVATGILIHSLLSSRTTECR